MEQSYNVVLFNLFMHKPVSVSLQLYVDQPLSALITSSICWHLHQCHTCWHLHQCQHSSTFIKEHSESANSAKAAAVLACGEWEYVA